MKSVIFDLDGTLIDSAPDLHAAANLMLAGHGLAPLDLATVIGFIGNGIPRLVERCFTYHGAAPDDPAAEIARFKACYDAEGHRRTVFMPAAEAALRQLADAGFALGICTNKDADAALAVLACLGAERFFAAVVGGDSGLCKKPEAAPLLATVAQCGGGDAIYVGDSETDAATAAAASLPFLLYTKGYRKGPPEEMVHAAAFSDFAELPGLVAAYSTPAPARPS
jgi:phosphoglycolate phosphatase